MRNEKNVPKDKETQLNYIISFLLDNGNRQFRSDPKLENSTLTLIYQKKNYALMFDFSSDESRLTGFDEDETQYHFDFESIYSTPRYEADQIIEIAKKMGVLDE